jgi:hypothetical protein
MNIVYVGIAFFPVALRVTRLSSRHHLWDARRNMHTNNTFKLSK